MKNLLISDQILNHNYNYQLKLIQNLYNILYLFFQKIIVPFGFLLKNASI